MENKELISNEYYPLSELFSTENRKIIIPDFQRDYCWGDKTHGEHEHKTDIVSGFLDTLIEEFDNNQKSDVLLGKIDVYEHPKNHIYLTDGQQRLTTLYLLIGMLHRKEQVEEVKSKLKRCLISDFEENKDDKEPYLQYAVRESSVFFLRDLVNEFFIKENSLRVADIQNQSWYFNEYNLDPSIISMLSALSIIENKLNEFKNGFSNFIINNIKIQYYDVQDKKHGEERFVIINTTGKSLTVSENIKPILLGKSPGFATAWEERETWFWKNRNKEKENENEKENIADNGVNDFLTWCFQIIEKKDEINIIKRAKELLKDKSSNKKYLEEIQNLFKSLELLVVDKDDKYLKEEKFQTQFEFINDNKDVKSIVNLRNLNKEKQQNILLPLLAFISKFKTDKDGTYQFLRRLRKNYFDQKWEERNVNYVDWRYVLQIIEKASSIDEVLQFETNENTISKIQNVPLNNWFNEEEKLKIELKKENKELIEEWEDHQDFMGDLSPLIDVVDNKNDISELEKYYDIYVKVNPDNFSFSDNIKLGNLYRLLSYLKNGRFEHRSVAGWGYCMLVKLDKKLFLNEDFNSYWKQFKISNEENIIIYLENELKSFFNVYVLRNNNGKIDFNDLIKDTREIGHYEKVLLWAILEYLHTNIELKFNNIAQFWEYPNLIKVKEENVSSEENNYSIGNLLLGTSYYNNKTGEFDYSKFPLMNGLHPIPEDFSDEQIIDRTKKISELLKPLSIPET